MDLTESELQEHRRERLAAWLKANGGAKRVCESQGLPKSVQSYISQVRGGFVFGQRAARNLEQKLGMRPHYLDEPDSGALTESATDASPEVSVLVSQITRIKDPQMRFRASLAAMNAVAAVLQGHSPAPTDGHPT